MNTSREDSARSRRENDDYRSRRENDAYNALTDLPPTATDLEIAIALSKHKIATAQERYVTDHGKLMIFHDVRKLRRNQDGPCPLPYDYRDKNTVGIKIGNDEARALDWCVKALFAGYAVFAGGGGITLAECRERLNQVGAANRELIAGVYIEP